MENIHWANQGKGHRTCALPLCVLCGWIGSDVLCCTVPLHHTRLHLVFVPTLDVLDRSDLSCGQRMQYSTMIDTCEDLFDVHL